MNTTSAHSGGPTRARALAASVRDALRAQLWPMPVLAVLVALVAAVLLPNLDEAIDDQLPGWFGAVLFNGGSDAARTVLDAIASSLITVTSLTFSLTVVTLQLASSQFSPRLLRTFSRDLFVQATLAVFLSTFVYALTVLRSVRSADQSQSLFVPRLAVSVAFVLAVVSVFGLVLFLAHLTRQIRVETMLHNVHDEASATMRVVLAERELPDAAYLAAIPEAPDDPLVVHASRSGFLTRLSLGDLLDAAREADAIVRLDSHPGSFLVAEVPFAVAWPVGGGAFAPDVGERLAEEVRSAVTTGFERTAAQDVAFGLRQLTDVANKALSPGINDPTTAVHALGHISALLCDLTGRRLGPETLRDEHDRIRVVLARPDFAELVDVAISQPRRYGAGDPQVLAQLYRLLSDLAWRVPADLRPVVTDHLERLGRTVAAQDLDPSERASLLDLHRSVARVLDR